MKGWKKAKKRERGEGEKRNKMPVGQQQEYETGEVDNISISEDRENSRA